jgi:serine/threonine-protein kinase SRPK3
LGNVLLRLPANFDKLSVEQVYSKFGEPYSQPVVRLDGKALTANVPPKATPPIWLGKASETFSPSDVRVLLADFGEAYLPSTECRHESHTPLSAAPPEVRFELQRGLSFSSDVWTLACAIWAILGQRPLFDEFLATQDDITAEQIDVLGGLPLEWWEKWETRYEYFSGPGEPKADRHVRSWEDRFESHIQRPRREAGIPEFGMEEKATVMDMLRSMLSFNPEKRSTMQDMLKCDWMVKWALPEYRRSCSAI